MLKAGKKLVLVEQGERRTRTITTYLHLLEVIAKTFGERQGTLTITDQYSGEVKSDEDLDEVDEGTQLTLEWKQ